MTPAREQWLKRNADRVREYKRRSNAKRYAEDPERFLEANRKWRRLHPEEVRERDRKYRERYASKRRVWGRKWRQSHRNYFRQRNQYDVDRLANWYVRERMSRGTSIAPRDWPEPLVQLNRVTIQIKRMIWQRQRTSPNFVTNS